MTEKIKALLATGRISNLPTVWCNCLAGSLIILNFTPEFNPWLKQMLAHYTFDVLIQFIIVGIYLVLCSSFIYVGGCFAGDYHDREFDAKHKPDRPIPSGILSGSTIAIVSILLMLTSIFSPFILKYLDSKDIIFNANYIVVGPPIIFLTVSVGLYSQYHKKSLFWGLPLIGLCRFFLVLFAAAGASLLLHFPYENQTLSYNYTTYKTTPYLILPIILYASAVCIYTIAFASVARTESSDSPITWRNLLRYTMLALPLTVLFTNQSLQIETVTALIIYALWLSYAFSFLSKNKGKYVSKCLAGFCLLDACFVAQFGWIWVVICIALFLLALTLQKVAPAT